VSTKPAKNSTIKVIPIVIFLSSLGSAAYLKQATIDAWSDYVQNSNARLEESCRGRNLFLQADKDSDERARLQHGEVIVSPAIGSTPKHVPFGLIHDWTASTFLPATHVEDVIDVLRSYAEYKQLYKPTVIESYDLGASEGGEKVSMIFRSRSIMAHTAVEGEYQASYTQLDEKRWYSIAYATRIQEIENYAQPSERKLDAGQGSGYIWRMQTIARFEERDSGVYIQVEAMALSRDVPGSLRWIVDPMIRRYARKSLTAHVTAMRDTVQRKTEAARRNGPLPQSGLATAFHK
jgi:hypothetical protein